MKKNTAYTIGSLVILLICAFCFVILPAFTGSGQKQETLPAFGKYKNKEIRYEQGSDFANFVTQYGQLYQNYGQQLDQSTYYYIFNYAFNSTAMQYAYTDAVKKSGYEVPHSAINRRLIPYFSDENGNYSSKIYKQTSDESKRELTENATKALISSRFFDDNFGSEDDFLGSDGLYGIKESDAELSFLQNYEANKRGFNMAVFNLSDFPEEEKVKYGKQNEAKFAKHELSIITVEDKSTANTVAKRLLNEELTFEDAVSEYSTKSYSDTEGKLTNHYTYQIENMLENPEDYAKVSDLKNNDLSEVIQTKSGYSIFKCTGATAKADFNDDETIRTITNYLTNYENTVIEDYFIAKAKDFKTEAMKSNFTDACETFEIENTEIAPFPLNYGNVELFAKLDTTVKGLSSADTNDNFLKNAFGLKLNEISAPFVLNNSVVVLQYTVSENASAEETVFNASEIVKYNQDSAQNAILSSDKLENNFSEVYFNNMMR